MSEIAISRERAGRRTSLLPIPRILSQRRVLPGLLPTLGFTWIYLSVLVLIPVGALVLKASTLSWAQMTSIVTARVTSTSHAMEAGVARVGEIESVSRDIDDALTTISAAAGRTREAAVDVTAAADWNVQAVNSAAGDIASIARTAESHAVAAQQVSASTQEQSAACEQMSSATSQLLAGSTQLRELVGGLKTV